MSTRPVACSGRTNTLSGFEIAVLLLHWPAFHEIAQAIPYTNDDGTPYGGRAPDYPKSIVLLLGVAARIERSLPKGVALLRPIGLWNLIRLHWEHAWTMGTIPTWEPATLPLKPPAAGPWRYASALLCSDPEAFERFENLHVEKAIELALSLGYFVDGSRTNPHLTSSVFADGTEIRSQTRSYIDERIDTQTGEIRLAAIDPSKGDGVRAWLEETPKGWVAIDPVSGRVSKKLPVDRDALRSGKYDSNENAFNVVPLSVRSEDANSRVTLWIGIDVSANDEAATILRGVDRISRSGLGGRIQCLITDMIIRGKHMTGLFQNHGIIPVTKVAARSLTVDIDEDLAGASGLRHDVVLEASSRKGRTVKSLHLGVKSHEVPGGTCRHMIDIIDGKVVEVDFDESGTKLLAIGELAPIQVKRAERVRDSKRYHFNVQFRVPCTHGEFDFWLCPHESQRGDDGRRIAENFRVFPEGSPVFDALYGIARNTSEGGNAHQKDRLPHRRSQATGRIAVHLEALLYFLAENAKTWYFQGGFETVDPLLHGEGSFTSPGTPAD